MPLLWNPVVRREVTLTAQRRGERACGVVPHLSGKAGAKTAPAPQPSFQSHLFRAI